MEILVQGLLLFAFGFGTVLMGLSGVGYMREAAPMSIRSRIIVLWLITSTVVSGLLTLDRGWSAVNSNRAAYQMRAF